MKRLKVLFAVQGDGCGHYVQALAVQRLLLEAGHRVCEVLVGSQGGEVPAFVRREVTAPITQYRTVELYTDSTGTGVDVAITGRRYFLNYPHYVRSTFEVSRAVAEHRPDVLLNFFEPVIPLYHLLSRPRVPIVSIANQYLFLHPEYRFAPAAAGTAWAAAGYMRLLSYGSRRQLALSLRPRPCFPSRYIVVPPLLRREILALSAERTEPFWLVYLLKPAFRAQIEAWHARHPEICLHCFLDLPAGQDELQIDKTLTFHRVDDSRFLDFLPRCAGVVATGGFTLIAEAMYCGKPLFVVPVANHFEQRCNAHEVQTLGAGLVGDEFNLDPFIMFARKRSDPQHFRQWVAQAPGVILEQIETVAQRWRHGRKW